MPDPTVPFPIAIDSSIRAAFVSCPQKAFRQYVQHLRRKGESVHLLAGGAFARGTEVTRKAYYDEQKTPEEALGLGLLAATSHYGDFDPGQDKEGGPHPKRLERVLQGLDHYFNRWPMYTDSCQPIKKPDGSHAIEFKFAVPLDIRHPQTGDPVLYFGRSDMVVSYNEGLYIFDDKTTSQLGASWPGSWRLRAQLDGYIWAYHATYGVLPKGGIVRGLSFLKRSFGDAESLQLRSKWQIARWYEQLLHDIKRMISCWGAGYWDYSLDDACTAYGGCPFVPLCTVENPEPWIEAEYEVKEWTPIELSKE